MKAHPRIVITAAGLAAALTAAAAEWPEPIPQEPVYASGNGSPTCCYSEDRIWRRTSNETGWSTKGRHFSPYGFARRDGYRPARPTPLPRGVDSANPWTGGDYVQRVAGRQGSGKAEFFRPAYYNYPPPVGPLPGAAGDPLDPLLLPTPTPALAADPYLGGLYLPGLAGPAGPWVAPGMLPGYWPGYW